MRHTVDWRIVDVCNVDAKVHGFSGIIEITYSENLDCFRYRVYDLGTENRFIKAYGTDPKISNLMAKLTKIKASWQEEVLRQKS
jgi:hypothetical protein